MCKLKARLIKWLASNAVIVLSLNVMVASTVRHVGLNEVVRYKTLESTREPPSSQLALEVAPSVLGCDPYLDSWRPTVGSLYSFLSWSFVLVVYSAHSKSGALACQSKRWVTDFFFVVWPAVWHAILRSCEADWLEHIKLIVACSATTLTCKTLNINTALVKVRYLYPA